MEDNKTDERQAKPRVREEGAVLPRRGLGGGVFVLN